jgi:hypothetical protein
LRPEDAAILLSMLRGITRESHVSRFTLVAFNLREQKIVHRQDNAGKIQFGQLGKTLQSRTAGTVDYHLLQYPRSGDRFAGRHHHPKAKGYSRKAGASGTAETGRDRDMSDLLLELQSQSVR